MRERRHRHIYLSWFSNMQCGRMEERILSGKMTSNGDSSGLAQSIRSGRWDLIAGGGPGRFTLITDVFQIPSVS